MGARADGCEECRHLNAHEFRTVEDLLHALQVAAAEVDRGLLEPVGGRQRGLAEHEALASIRASEPLAGRMQYRFRCTVCGGRFELTADAEGHGGWNRETA